MSPRGPAPQPTALRLLTGSHMERANPDEPIPVEAEAECPPGTSELVRDVWDFTVRELRAMRTLHRCDRDSLLAYCEAVASHRKASRLLASSDVLIKGEKGQPIRNPALQVQRDAATLIRVYAQEFGLTPASRTRIRVEEAQAGVSPSSGDGNPFAGTATG